METETKVSIDASAIRRYREADAVAFVHTVLGDGATWLPSLVGFRLTSETQEDWKIEVGCWLLLARDLGFLDALNSKLNRARQKAKSRKAGGPNDKAHLVLNQELAPAMAIYYFTAFGWRFAEWEPARNGGDVDVRLQAPDGRLVDLQVKAPDQPGEVRNGRRVGGEIDQRVLDATTKALGQLRGTPGPCRMVVISPQRTFDIRATKLVGHLVGSLAPGSRNGSYLVVRKAAFGDECCGGISAVADLHLLPGGAKELLYRCTVLPNPWCLRSASLPVEAFPHSRILSSWETELAWVPEPPSG